MKTMTRFVLSGAVLLAVAACTPKAAEKTEASAPALAGPSEVMKATFQDCTWGEQTVAGLTISTFACPRQRLVADDALPGFLMEITDGEGKVAHYTSIQVFAKAPDAPVDAVLPAVRAASPGPYTAACVLTPNANDTSGKTFLFTPTGAGLAAHAAFLAGKSEQNSMPCGEMGPSEAGERVFQIIDGAPDKVVYVNFGSEIQIFDANTLHVAK